MYVHNQKEREITNKRIFILLRIFKLFFLWVQGTHNWKIWTKHLMAILLG